jgi:PAS domain S-box-containing protein
MNVNPALCHMHGYDSPEEMLREVPSVEDHLFSDPGQRAFFFALLEKHGRVKAFESRVNTRKDSKIWVSINARAIAGANGAARLEGTMENITERKRAESMMLAAQRSLEDLSRTLLKKLEAERHHVAHELHDEVGQVLTVVKMGLESIKREPASSAFADKLDENIAAIKRALAQVRNLSVNLRPAVLDDLGLVAALRWLASSATSSTGLDIEVQADDDIEPRLSSGLATVCFRVAQEALTNALRHAGASTIKIELCGLRKEFALIISDDGKGFDVKAARAQTSHGGGFGLLAMQERTALSGGTLTIDSTPGEGSKITALFPIRREEEGR